MNAQQQAAVDIAEVIGSHLIVYRRSDWDELNRRITELRQEKERLEEALETVLLRVEELKILEAEQDALMERFVLVDRDYLDRLHKLAALDGGE